MRLILALLLAGAAQAQVAPTERVIPRSTLPGIGAADRRMPVDAGALPWSALGRVQTELGGRCTGVLIAPDRVLTAAHCLAARRSGQMVQPGSVHFLQGFSRGEYSGHARVAAYAVGEGWDPARRGAVGADWAVLRLAQRLSGPMLPLWAGEVPAGAALMLGGYQQDRPEVLLADTGCALLGRARDAAGAVLLAHGCTATRGASGAPLLLVLPGGRFAVAGVSSVMALGAARGFAVPAEAIRSPPTRE